MIAYHQLTSSSSKCDRRIVIAVDCYLHAAPSIPHLDISQTFATVATFLRKEH